MNKMLLRPERQRQIPPQFSWIDQRLARQRWFECASPESWLLYTFLVTVADAQGLSFYSDRTLCQRLRLRAQSLSKARSQLQRLDLIAYRAPLTQVLEVPAAVVKSPASVQRPDAATLHKQIAALRQALRPRAQHDD